MGKGPGGGQTKKQLILVFVVMFTLFVHAPSGMGIVAACILFGLTLVAVFHNGVQLFDFIVAFALGVFCATTYVGEGTQNIIQTAANWVGQVVG
jgi:hypothetical protein